MVNVLVAIALLPSSLFSVQKPVKDPVSLGRAVEKTAEELYKQALPSVVTLDIQTADGKASTATGFLAMKDGVAITSWSLIAGAKSIVAKFSDGDEYDVSGVIDSDSKRDLALIRIKESGRPFLQLDASDVSVGTAGVAIGPLTGPKLSFGKVSISKNDVVSGMRQLQFAAKISPDAIGGPVIASNGKVMGILSGDGRDADVGIAVPAKYASGLDASLPTTPLSSVRPSETDATANTAFDSATLAAVGIQLDCMTASQVVIQTVIKKESGFRQGVPSLLYEVFANIDGRARALQANNPADDARRQVRDELLESLDKIKDGLDMLSKAILQAQEAGGWTAVPQDQYSRAMGTLRSAESDQEAIVAFLKIPSVRKLAPVTTLRAYGVEPEPFGYRLGTISLSKDMLSFLVVPAASFASVLGFQDGDRLQTVEGKPVTSLDDFKGRVKSSLGITLKVGVLRQGKNVEFDMKIPDQIPASSLTSSSE